MQKVSVQTTQNVKIDYELADLGTRIIAYLIDALIIAGYGLFWLLVVTNMNTEPGLAIFILLYLPVFFYHLTSELLMDGQSLGKKQMKIKVIKLDGSQPSLGNYVLRWIIRPVDFFFYGGVAILCISLGGKGQRLGDLAASTTVIRMKRRVALKDQIINKQMDEGYVPQFQSVTNLQDKDIEIIKEALKVYKDTGNAAPVNALVRRTRDVMSVSTDMAPVQFLHTVVKDYNYLTAIV